jgi:hypothetical protein
VRERLEPGRREGAAPEPAPAAREAVQPEPRVGPSTGRGELVADDVADRLLSALRAQNHPTPPASTRIQRTASGLVQRDDGPGGVTIEDVEEEDAPRAREPVPVAEPATPLMLTDRPWAEIEQEREARSRVTIEDVEDEPAPRSREPVPVGEPATPLMLTDRRLDGADSR